MTEPDELERKRRRRAAVKRLHPDAGGATEEFITALRAFEAPMDPVRPRVRVVSRRRRRKKLIRTVRRLLGRPSSTRNLR